MNQGPGACARDSEPHVTLAGTKKRHLLDYLHDYRSAHQILKNPFTSFRVSAFLREEGRGREGKGVGGWLVLLRHLPCLSYVGF